MRFSILKRLCFLVRRALHIVVTKWRLSTNSVTYSTYRSYGSPYISTESGTLHLGKDFAMNNGMHANQIGYNTPCVFRCEGADIRIGDNVGMSQTAIVAKDGADVTIGNNVRIGGGVKIYSSDFHSPDYMDRREWKSDLAHRKSAPVSIGDDCFIGAGTIILKGVDIGARTVIGAGSVVTKSMPSDCICGGNPCKVIRIIPE
ncbi:MAG: acyltransferase [Bacteroidales bacterium]|nr:acyltransferase [Bacteroidales bacterium]